MKYLIPLALLLCAGALWGCASPPVKVSASPFERCIGAIGGTAGTGWYVNERIRAADWCQANNSGGITAGGAK